MFIRYSFKSPITLAVRKDIQNLTKNVLQYYTYFHDRKNITLAAVVIMPDELHRIQNLTKNVLQYYTYFHDRKNITLAAVVIMPDELHRSIYDEVHPTISQELTQVLLKLKI